MPIINDKKFMQQAIGLALKAKAMTSPNPLVGAIIVKNNKIISTGYHKIAGGDHAEVIALKKAGIKAKNATMYVSFEPCSTYGKTPPCTKAIIKSGIKNVVLAMVDLNPKHTGRGINILRKNGIKVTTGILKDEARKINQPFIKYITTGLPYVTYKTGQSLDGRIATKTGDSNFVTSTIARDYSHKKRDEFDAIMVGGNTVLQDNPRLSLNKPIKGKKFYKIVIDTDLKISTKAKLFDDLSDFTVIIATSKESFEKKSNKVDLLNRMGVVVFEINKNKNWFLSIKELLKKLSKMGIINIFVEGGGALAGSLFDERLVDQVMFFIAPKIVGGCESLMSVQGNGISKMSDAQSLKDIKIRNLGNDLLVEGVINWY